MRVADTPDPLDRLLHLVLAEGALEADSLEAFAEALRERAGLVLEERLRPLEQRNRGLVKRIEAQDRELAWLRETVEKLKLAEQAHDRLLAHHRAVLEKIVAAVERAVARLPRLGGGEARQQLAELVALIEKELE
jgi:hypothetical protein